jgi:pimeloyl-ACP methyl ester carboxylesterase
LISPQMVRGLSQHADDLTVEVLHDAGHWLPNECPDVIIGEARSFLR